MAWKEQNHRNEEPGPPLEPQNPLHPIQPLDKPLRPLFSQKPRRALHLAQRNHRPQRPRVQHLAPSPRFLKQPSLQTRAPIHVIEPGGVVGVWEPAVEL